MVCHWKKLNPVSNFPLPENKMINNNKPPPKTILNKPTNSEDVFERTFFANIFSIAQNKVAESISSSPFPINNLNGVKKYVPIQTKIPATRYLRLNFSFNKKTLRSATQIKSDLWMIFAD